MKAPARVLIVAGSDSSGGAGIQADIKTATALGAYAMTAITAVTVQDTRGVQSFHSVPPKIVGDQITAVLSDIGADAIKTGMLVSAAIVETVADALQPYRSIPLVVDTVMIAKGGTALLDDAGVDAMKKQLFPVATLITPNAPEASRLAGFAVETPDDLVRAGQRLEFHVIDKDLAVNDTIGKVEKEMTAEHLKSGKIRLEKFDQVVVLEIEVKKL
jgi:hydroxymethylpyrimidine/phosphomethylpyrimidine kinase